MHRPTFAALLLFVVLSLVLTYPLPLHLDSAVEDRQDALLNVWITAWDGHQLLADPVHLFDANIFHPYPRTLAYSELLLGNGLLALPITAVTGNPILGYNIALLLSFVLSGFGTYLLVLGLVRSPSAGVVAGIIFAFSAYRMTNMAQAQLLTTQWLPFALLALHQLLRHPRVRTLAIFCLFFCLQALSSFYYAILLALAVAAFAIWLLVFERPEPDSRPWSRLGFLLLAVLLCALIMLPFALPYFQVQRELGFERSLADNEPFSASLRQYLMVPPGSVVHERWLPSDDTPIAGGYPLDALFPGFVALALGLLGLIRGRGRTRWFFLLLMGVAFVLSLGPRLYLAPGQPSGLDVMLPYGWLYAIVPGFKALRAPARFDALVMLSLAALGGYGVAYLESVLCRRRARPSDSGASPGWLALGVLLAGLVALEFWVLPAAQVEAVPVGDGVPAVYHWLAEQEPDPILELPMAFTPGGPKLEHQYFSTYHWQTTPDGYSGFIPPKHGQIVYELERFPSERSVSLLQALGVRHVIVHTDGYLVELWSEMERVLSETQDLTPLEPFGADHIYEVQARTFDAGQLQVSAHIPSRAVAGEPYAAYAIAVNQGTRSYAVQPTDAIQPVMRWHATGESEMVDVLGDLPLVISPDGGAVVVPLLAEAPAAPGRYEVTIGEPAGPWGPWSAGGEVEVGEHGDAGFPVPVRIETWSVPSTAQPGGELPVDLIWHALGKIDAYYSVYVKLLDAESNAVAGWDGQPGNGRAPTLLWAPGERISDRIVLALPEDVPPGDYVVEVGMYRADDLARGLTLNEAGVPVSSVTLGTVRILP